MLLTEAKALQQYQLLLRREAPCALRASFATAEQAAVVKGRAARQSSQAAVLAPVQRLTAPFCSAGKGLSSTGTFKRRVNKQKSNQEHFWCGMSSQLLSTQFHTTRLCHAYAGSLQLSSSSLNTGVLLKLDRSHVHPSASDRHKKMRAAPNCPLFLGDKTQTPLFGSI